MLNVRELAKKSLPPTNRSRGKATKRSSRSAPRGSISGVVLAGTHPWGRCVLDQAVPRPLLPVANRPLIRYAIEWMEQASPSRITICGNSDTPALRGGLASESDLQAPLDFHCDPMPRGPAGCAKDAAAGHTHGSVVVADGTIVPEIDLGDLISAHERSRAVLTVVVVRNHSDGTSRSDEMVPMGIYVFSPSVLEMIPTDGYQDIKESLIPKLYAAGLQVGTYVAKSQAPRVTGADAYMAVNDWAVQRLCAESTAPPEHSRLAESWVHQSASIHPSARLIGPVLIGASAIIGRGACIVGPTSVGSGSRIEADTVICRSAIWDDCSIGVGGNVDRCIVAHHAHIDDGAALRGTVTLTEQARLPLLERVQARWPKRLALGSAAPSEPRICKPGFAA